MNDAVLWLRDVYAELRQRESFVKLSPQHQIDALIDAMDHPQRAAIMRRWSPAEQSAVLAALARAAKERPARQQWEFWTMTRGGRTLRAIGVRLEGGAIDLQLLEGDDFWRTRRCQDEEAAWAVAAQWKSHLRSDGWTPN